MARMCDGFVCRRRFKNEECDHSIIGCYVDEKALVLVTSDGDFQVVRHGAWKEPRAESFRGGEKASLEMRLTGLGRAEA